MIRFLREFRFAVDPLLPGSRLQAMKALLYADDERREKERQEQMQRTQEAPKTA